MRKFIGALLSLSLAFAAQNAAAAPCAGFTDVDDSSAFCTNVTWIKNRGVTLGCTATTTYCPGDAVSRLAMAAFMNRLGIALLPTVRVREELIPPTDLTTGVVVCALPAELIVGHARIARVDASIDLLASQNDAGFILAWHSSLPCSAPSAPYVGAAPAE